MPTSPMLALSALSVLLASPSAATLAGAVPTVTGMVTTVVGSPLGGARVSLTPLPSSFLWGRMVLSGRAYPEPIASVATDAAGRFTLTAPSKGLWSVVVEAPGFVPIQLTPLALTESVELPKAVLVEGGEVDLSFKLPGEVPAARVWVLVASGTPTALGPSSGGGWAVSPRLGLTAVDGALRLPRAKGEEFTVQALVEGGPVVRTAIGGGVVSLQPAAASVRQIEVRGHDGRPVPGVQVRLGDVPVPTTITGADGRADLKVPLGRVKVRLLAEDGRRRAATLPDMVPEVPVVLTLPPPQRLAGRVIDSSTRRPLVGALVWLSPDPGAFAITAPQGAYRLSALDANPTLRADATGYLAYAGKLHWKPGDPGRAPTVALDAPATVNGLVVDGKGAPLPSAQIQTILRSAARQRTFSRSGQPERRAETGPDGRFRLDRLVAGETWELRVLRPGFAPARLTLLGLEPGKVRSGIRIVLGRGRNGFGRVIDSKEKPVAGAEVALLVTSGERAPAREKRKKDGDGIDSWVVTTGADGHFELPGLPAGSVDLKVAKSGFAPITARAVAIPGGEGPFDLGTVVLEAAVEMTGRVTERDGKPVMGAEVHIVEDLRRFQSASQAGAQVAHDPEAVTGSDGRFTLSDLRRGDRLDLWVTAAGYRPGSLPGVMAPNLKPVTIVLERGAQVAGRVTDGEGMPVPGAGLELRSERAGGERGLIRFAGGSTFSAIADDDGRFTLVGVPLGAVELRATADGFQPLKPRSLDVPARGIDDLDVVLERGAVIEGRVLTADGQPVEDARVVCGPAASISDADGVYRLDGVSLGSGKVQLLHRDFPPLNQGLDVHPGVNPLDLILPKGYEVAGRVVDPDGKGIAGASIALFPPGSPHEREAVSAAEGSFRFPAAADGAYSLRAGAMGYCPREIENAVTVAGAPVRDLTVRLDRGTRIAGRILGLALYDLAAVDVRARWDDGSHETPGRVDYAGSYEIDNLGPGDWLVVATLRDGGRETRGRASLATEAEEVRVDLEFGRDLTLSGRVLYGGEPLPGADVTLRGQDVSAARLVTTDYQGDFRVEDLKPGQRFRNLR